MILYSLKALVTGSKKEYTILLIFQFLIIFSLFLVGKFEFFPHLITSHGYAYFASDSIACHAQAIELRSLLLDDNWSAWWETESRFHTRLASFAYACWGNLSGMGILSYWPINMIALFITLFSWKRLVSQIGGQTQSLFWMFFLIPSILIHFTQLIRDPLYISLFLLWLSYWIELFHKDLHKDQNKAFVIILIISPFLFAVRTRFWVLCQVMSFTWLAISFILSIRSVKSWKLTGLIFLLFLTINTYTIIKVINGHTFVQHSTISEGEAVQYKQKFNFLYKVASLRDGFNRSYRQPSNIDQHISFQNDMDVIQYLPRATQIGLFTPFPNQWFNPTGKTGNIGRSLSIVETIIMLCVMLSVFYYMFSKGISLPLLIAFSAILISTIALGLVVTNGGAIYRMRYASWLIWLAILAANLKPHFQDRSIPQS